MHRTLPLLALLLAPLAHASEIGSVRPAGLGLAVGEPVAITGKVYLDRHRLLAVEVAVGVDLLSRTRGSARLHTMVHLHPLNLVDTASLEIPVRVGLGPVAGLWFKHPDPITTGSATDDPEVEYRWRPNPPRYLGARVVGGVDLDFDDAPLQLFAEAGLDLVLVPDVVVGPTAALGARYYF